MSDCWSVLVLKAWIRTGLSSRDQAALQLLSNPHSSYLILKTWQLHPVLLAWCASHVYYQPLVSLKHFSTRTGLSVHIRVPNQTLALLKHIISMHAHRAACAHEAAKTWRPAIPPRVDPSPLMARVAALPTVDVVANAAHYISGSTG
jgi:hypothetical protein